MRNGRKQETSLKIRCREQPSEELRQSHKRKEPTQLRRSTESARMPNRAATEKVNKVFCQIRSYVKDPSSTKDSQNDYF